MMDSTCLHTRLKLGFRAAVLSTLRHLGLFPNCPKYHGSLEQSTFQRVLEPEEGPLVTSIAEVVIVDLLPVF